MEAMRIPQSFCLMGQRIVVRFDDSLSYVDDVQGWARYRTGEIVLQPRGTHSPRPHSAVEHSFCHEMVHHILYAAGEDGFDPPLHKREYLVDRIAGLLHQALVTFEYGEEGDEQ